MVTVVIFLRNGARLIRQYASLYTAKRGVERLAARTGEVKGYELAFVPKKSS